MGAIRIADSRPDRSFVSALYLYGLALRFVTLAAISVVDHHNLEHLMIVSAIILADGSVFVWQWSHYARVAKQHFLNTGRFFSWLIGYILLFLVGLVSVYQWWNIAQNVSLSPREWVEQIVEPKPPAPLNTEDHPRYKLHLSGDRKTLSMTGVFEKKGVVAFENAVNQNPQLTRITLDSHGGDLFAARDIARAISDRGLNTHIDRMCSATCILPFAAGIQRTMGIGAEMGFHAYGLDFLKFTPYIDLAEEKNYDRRFLQSRNFSSEILDSLFATDRSILWFPSQIELAKAGVVTAQ